MQNNIGHPCTRDNQCVTIWQKNCWFTKEVLDQKKMLRRREKIWQEYKTDSTWRALAEHRNKYNAMIWEEKVKATLEKVNKCKGDTKKLYSLVRYLTGTKAQIPMPDNNGNEKLTNNFVDYFIQKIQDNLDDYPKFKPRRNSTSTPLNNFELTTADEVTKNNKGNENKILWAGLSTNFSTKEGSSLCDRYHHQYNECIPGARSISRQLEDCNNQTIAEKTGPWSDHLQL